MENVHYVKMHISPAIEFLMSEALDVYGVVISNTECLASVKTMITRMSFVCALNVQQELNYANVVFNV